MASKTTSTIVDARDGRKYSYINIGVYDWMTENMRYNVPGSKYNPDNPDSTYGRLYTWPQAMEACPEGWDLVSQYDWMSIEQILFSDSIEENMYFLWKDEDYRGYHASWIKANRGWNPRGTDSLGLSILPSGIYWHLGYEELGQGAYFWTANTYIQDGKYIDPIAVSRILYHDKDGIASTYHFKENMYFSCRCVRYVKEEEEEEKEKKRHKKDD